MTVFLLLSAVVGFLVDGSVSVAAEATAQREAVAVHYFANDRRATDCSVISSVLLKFLRASPKEIWQDAEAHLRPLA